MPYVAQAIGIDIDTPFKTYPKTSKNRCGTASVKVRDQHSKQNRQDLHMDHAQYENAFNAVEDSLATTKNERAIERLNRFYEFGVCPTCHGSRFAPKLLAQHLVDQNIAQVSDMTLTQLTDFIPKIYQWLPANMQALAHDIIKELTQLLKPIMDLGLSYLTLSRAAASLSTGELQRIQA